MGIAEAGFIALADVIEQCLVYLAGLGEAKRFTGMQTNAVAEP